MQDSLSEVLSEFTPDVIADLREIFHELEGGAMDLEDSEKTTIPVLKRFLDVMETCNDWVSVKVEDQYIYGPTAAVLRVQELLRYRPTAKTWEELAVEDMGLQVLRPSSHQIQFRQEGKVLADWWPGKGTTLADGKRGPVCRTGEEVLDWLRTL